MIPGFLFSVRALEDFEEKTEGLWTEEASLSPALRDF